MGPVLVALHRVGPYHHARFQAAAEALQQPLLVLQTRPQSQEYPWSFAVDRASYTLMSLEGGLSPEQDPPLAALKRQLHALLDQFCPEVLVSVGWADRAYMQLLFMAQQRSVPLVVVSDSRSQDSVRTPIREWLKRYLLRGYSAGLVAGTQSRDYLEQLGMRPEAICQPWDVVDNQRFSQMAAEAALDGPPLSERPFLCVGRFIAEKNHALLMQAYGRYQQTGGTRPLLLVGHGPLEQEIRVACSQLLRPMSVTLAPFVQLEQLGHYYGQSHALVLPSAKDTWGLVVNEAMAAGLPVIVSRACGCAQDLLGNGEGWCFPSGDPDALADCLHQVDGQVAAARQQMVGAARQRLESFSPEAFAQSFVHSCEYARTHPCWSVRSQLIAAILRGVC